MNRPISVYMLLVLICGCAGHAGKQDQGTTDGDRNARAKGFAISHEGPMTRIRVLNPWQGASQVAFTYILSDKFDRSVYASDTTMQIRIPLNKVVCFSTTHLGFLHALDQLQTIVGISGMQYVVNPALQQRIEKGELTEVGYDEQVNFEQLLAIKPDAVFLYGVTGKVTHVIDKLRELDIPVVLVGEYLEEDPLARLDWIRFFGSFYAMESRATCIYDSLASLYSGLKKLAFASGSRPKVLLGLPWRGTWYISGGDSYSARLINDAGGNYLFNGLKYADSRPMELEQIYESAAQADFWLNTGSANTLEEILSVDPRFTLLPAFKKGNLFNNNRRLNQLGGNDFYEQGVVEPHLVLSDMIAILHPQLLPSHQFRYYRKLE